jgi:anaerobic selenocysteine-containing dehydrogenase
VFTTASDTGCSTLLKQDRDAKFVARDAAGTSVNRWTTTGMLAASASSSETAYLTWKVPHSFGMLVFDHQARVGHGPTVAGLAPTFGRSVMTKAWQDIKNADVVLGVGGNAAEAHPCGFKWVIEAKIENQARLVVVS